MNEIVHVSTQVF